ncbi:metal-sulfur cluster assembly factor [Halorussus salilacus]|uniref:metal-sulfur cluster assembly factor n=1 Tax=Halorussus salilacus TaxID=2953750 RepID=UPI0020A1CEF2|nr:iron-sulfur cluster assembly protein [Halorussus salilacus]USZ68001.1 metal-sulfur cluster assembly factor [Halorussus salilacus]
MSFDTDFDPSLEPDADCEDVSDIDPLEEPSACAYTDYTSGGEAPDEVPATGEGAEGVEADVWDALYGVEDPEMPVSVVDLGLIYGVDVTERVDREAPEEPHGGGDSEARSASDRSSGRRPREETAGVHAEVVMTLTYTGCPARDMLTGEIEDAVASVEGVESVDLRLVWSPEWSIELVTEAGKDDLREFGLSV